MLMNNLRNFPPVTLGIFQSTLLQEERLKLKYIQNGNSYFNPRSYKRSNCNGAVCTWKDCNFNPRSYKRSDQLSRKLILFASYFNPRSYKRSDFVFAHFFFLPKFQSTLLQDERRAKRRNYV